ncbi:MAG: hypothetical protein E5V74_01240 [Mesorhizobium sp.]|nr:MAG: hypothetical protein E5V74_01240 [Mesorhizobium sp.]
MSTKSSRAFIIGDKEQGLTIVITDPVMVLHYSDDDLKNPAINQMSGKDRMTTYGAVVQELLPFLRGVHLDFLKQRETEIKDVKDNPHGTFDLDYERKVFEELDNAAAIGRVIRNNGTVCDVDFCVALTIDPGEIVAKARSAGPAVDIRDYIRDHMDAKAPPTRIDPPYVISNLTSDNLDELPPWPEKP